jgi:glutathione S-transferase
MKLIGSLTSPYARKVRIVLAEKRIDYDLTIDNVWDPSSRISEYNPLGKVPVLILDDGSALYDSSVIVEYLDTATPVGRLIPQPTRQRIQVRRWEALADGVLDAATGIVLEGKRAESLQSPEWVSRQRGKIDRGLTAMSSDLAEQTWCTGSTFNLADIVTGCALFYLDLRFAGFNWRSQYANLSRLADKLATRVSFKDTAPQLGS